MTAAAAFALAGAAAFLGCLAFAAFVMWMRACAAPSEFDGPKVMEALTGLGEADAEHQRAIGDLAGKVNALTVATGLRQTRTKV
jgi:hypothetical protein